MTTETLHHHDHHHDEVSSKVTFGFWTYIMTDFIMFAAMFATYIVLRDATYGGIGIAQILNLPYDLTQTIVMLGIGLIYGLGFASAHHACKKGLVLMLILSLILGFIFLGLQHREFAHIFALGYSWKSSAFLSAYFTLMTLFCLHLIVGMFWTVVLLVQLGMQGLTSTLHTRFTCLGIFWNFLTIVWIIAFTIVYLMGAI